MKDDAAIQDERAVNLISTQVGARASIERLSAPTRGAIRAVASADVAASESAETRLERRRDGFYCCVGNSIGLKDDHPRARFGQIGALERDCHACGISGH